MRDLDYGLTRVCIPAQRARMSTTDFEKDNRRKLILVRQRLSNTTQVNAWTIGARGETAVMENEAGCTVSFSAWGGTGISEDVRSYLTGRADKYQVVAGDPERANSTLVVAFCAENAPGVVDSWYLYESIAGELDVTGQIRDEAHFSYSIVVPTQPFCAQE
ncbi:hypothetical protein [Parvularcula marina]